MKKKLTAILTAAITLSACGTVNETQEANVKVKEPKNIQSEALSAQGTSDVSAETSGDFIKGAADFSAELFKAAVASGSGENVLVSPESVLMCMGMAANGAEGETLDELTNTLVGGSLDTLNSGAKDWYTRQNAPEQIAKVSCANSAWLKNGLNVKQDYINSVSDIFGAEIFLSPLDSSAVPKINNWVSGKTDDMIPELVDALPSSAKMVLINAVCFDGEWYETYEDGQCISGEFTASDGSASDVTMMCSVENKYVEDGSVTGFIKPYKGNYDFMAFLPNEDVSVEDYAASLDGEKLMGLYNGASSDYDVYCRLPKFTYDWGNDLNDILSEMGIHRAFDENDARFGGMTDETALYINKVIHKTHITVDQNGTKAAAATAALMTDGAVAMSKETKEVWLDRPFIYTIIDRSNGLPVFIGCVNQINK